MTDAVVAAVIAGVPATVALVTPSTRTASLLQRAGREVTVVALDALPDGAAEALALIDDELTAAGDRAEALLAAAARAVRPGGLLAVSAVGAIVGTPAAGGMRAEDLRRLLSQRGLDVGFFAAPGAAGRLRGDPAPTFDPALDRLPGLWDAGERLVAVARTPRSAAERSRVFFAGLPRKVVAAAALVRDGHGRLLVVFDSFKRQWTIPGGVVDADEDPRSGAARETWEEAGIRVRVGNVLGLFAASIPDRIVIVYEAVPHDPAASPAPRHPEEIAAAEWVDLAEARERLAPVPREQVERCLAAPGGTWRQEAVEPGY